MITIETEERPDPDAFTDSRLDFATGNDLVLVGDALHQHGITRAAIRYEDSGNSGAVTDVEFAPPDLSVPDAVSKHLCAVAKGDCPDGYQNDDGGFGSLTVYPVQGLTAVAHDDRYENAEAFSAEPVTLPDDRRERPARCSVITVTERFDGYGDSG